MSEDGLLKKRVKHKAENRVVICPHDTNAECDCKFDVDVASVNWFNKLIDEAKKDFLSQMRGENESEGVARQAKEIETFLRFRTDIFVWKWFKKWFGE